MAGAIFAASSFTPKTRLPAPGYSDKVIHLAIYTLFAFLVTRAMVGTWPNRARWPIALISFFIAFFYGISDEFHQMYVPGRTPDFFDLIFDWLGAGLGIIIYFRLVHYREGIRHDRPT
jgi:VanZ family protein